MRWEKILLGHVWLIPGNVRLKVLDKHEKDVGGGKRLTIYCVEE